MQYNSIISYEEDEAEIVALVLDNGSGMCKGKKICNCI